MQQIINIPFLMIVTLSPAKILDFESEVTQNKSTLPVFQKEAIELNSLLKSLSAEEIAKMMKVNPQLAHSTYEYIHSFDMEQVNDRQAAYAYNGIAYQGLDINTFSDADLEFSQNHLLLFSGIYGVLRPLDRIKPYRLEMQTKLPNRKGKTLYDFWKDTLTKHMSDAMQKSSNVWINLTSKEYSKVIDRKKLPKGHLMIMPEFREYTDNGYKQVVVYTKKARGMMARFIMHHQLTEVEHLKAFDTEGYTYSEQLSGDEEWVFIR